MAGVGRGKNYTDDEHNQLCYSVMHISQDPAVGNGQRAERLWDRVQDHYNQNRPEKTEVRAKKSLESKWADIRHDVSKFIGCYGQVEERQTSGTNEEDTLKSAKELYKDNHPKSKSFGYETCWTILRNCPKFAIPQDEMPKKLQSKKLTPQRSTGKEKAPSESPSPEIIAQAEEGEQGEANESTNISSGGRRPMGNKRAKEELKRARITDDVMRMTAEAQIEQAAAAKDMARANYMRARTMENNSTIALLSLPTDAMDPELQAFMQLWKLEEARKLKVRMQETVEDPPRERLNRPNVQVLPAMFPAVTNQNPLPFVRRQQFPLTPRMADSGSPFAEQIPDVPDEGGLPHKDQAQATMGHNVEVEPGEVPETAEDLLENAFLHNHVV